MAIRNTNLGGSDYVVATSTLNGVISDSDTTLTLNDATNFPSSGHIIIEDELIQYSGKSTNDLTGLTRGVGYTTALSHADTTTVTFSEQVKGVDLKDTLDAMYNEALANPAFWLNSEWYDVYDDFESYSTGAFTTNAKWSVSTTGSSNVTVVAGTTAGGTGQELRLAAIDGSAIGRNATVTSLTLSENKHTFVKFRNYSGDTINNSVWRIRVGNSTDGWTNVFTKTRTTTSNGQPENELANNLLIIAKGSHTYDVYYGGNLAVSGLVLTVAAQTEFYVSVDSNGSAAVSMAVDDVRQSKSEII